MNKNILSALIATSLLVSGCSTMERVKDTGEQLGDIEQSATQSMAQAEQRATSGSVVHLDRPRISGDQVVIRTNNLPAVFNEQIGYRTDGAQTLSGVLRTVADIAGLKIRTTEIFEGGNRTGGSSGMDNLVDELVAMQYHGPVRGLLDEIASRYDVSWRHDARSGDVVFFRYATRAVNMSLPPGEKSVAASINLSGSGGGEGGSATSGSVSVDHESSINPWVSVMQGVESILGTDPEQAGSSSGGGSDQESPKVSGRFGHAVANPELGIVTVTARPAYLDRVEEYLQSINERFAKNILIDVKVYSVSVDDAASAGISADMALTNFLSSKLAEFGLEVESAPVASPSTGTPGTLRLSTVDNTGRVSTQSVVQALSRIGKVGLKTQGQVIAINGQPAPFQAADTINYIERTQTTVVPDAGTTTTSTPGTAVVGFTANFIPMVLNGNRIMLQYQMQISNLVSMDRVGSGDGMIMLPQISSQSLQQQALLKDGETIMLFGFDQNRSSQDGESGMLSLSRLSESGRNMTVILIRASTGGLG